jgi:hypothetical protein
VSLPRSQGLNYVNLVSNWNDTSLMGIDCTIDVMRAMLWSFLAFCVLQGVDAHAKLLCPLPRQYRNERPDHWTHWQGIVVVHRPEIRTRVAVL